MFLQLYIINKAGGLIYNQDLSSAAPKLGGNDYLRLGSTFHGLHAIAEQIAPVASGGIQYLETDTYKLQCFQTLTGMKFFVTAELQTGNLEAVLSAIYELYTDFVLKNPFYELEMPIRIDLFSQSITRLIERYEGFEGKRKHYEDLMGRL